MRRLACILLTTGALSAQKADLAPAADAWIESFVPSRDDPDATVHQLLAAAQAIPSLDITARLIGRIAPSLGFVEDPDAVLTRLRAFLNARPEGEATHETRVQMRSVWLRQARFDELAGSDVFAGYATHFTVIGPFGDDGDHHTGVEFPPEREFPQPGVTLPGRFGPITTRLATRPWDRYRVNPRDPHRRRGGCFYVLHQCVVKTDTPCYLRLWCNGSFTVFVNGERVAVVDRNVAESGPLHFIPVVLKRGHNHVLVKTTTNDDSSLGRRYLDPTGATLTGIEEFAEAPRVRPAAEHKASVAKPAPCPEVDAGLLAAAQRSEGDAKARLLLAAAFLAVLDGRHLRVMEIVDKLQRTPPKAPRLRLALAQAVRLTRLLPDSIRRNVANTLVTGLGDALPNHYTLLLHRLSQLEDRDQREAAIRLLRRRIAAGLAGPGTYSRLTRLYSHLGFRAELRRLRTSWRKAVPRDLRPIVAAVRTRRRAGDGVGAMRLLREARTKAPGDLDVLSLTLDLATDRGDEKLATAALANLFPRETGTPRVLSAHARLARKLGQEDRFLELQSEIGRHPKSSLSRIRDAAGHLLAAGRMDSGQEIARRAIQKDTSDQATRRTLQRLAGRSEFPNIEAFRVDVGDVLRRFQPTDREQGATSTLLLDHMILEVFPDGSAVEEVHTLRRINDRNGVEQFENAGGAASADEVVSVRTIGVDGESYVPNRVQGRFSMPRLAPGALIEEQYRNFRSAPGADPWRATKFYFQNQKCAFLRSELVVILPPGHKGTFRLRNFTNSPVVKKLADGKTAHIYRVDDSPRLATEFARPAVEDVMPMLAFGEDGSHAAEARSYFAESRRRNIVTPIVRRQAQALVAGLSGDKAKAIAIHEFVQHEIVPARASASPTSILMLKKGPGFFLELALLKAAGIPFRYGLCVERRAALRREAKPFYDGETPYELPCARIEPHDTAPMWLFADNPRYMPLGEIPSARQDGEVMLVGPLQELRLPAGDLRGGQGIGAIGNLTIDAIGTADLDLEIRFRGVNGYAYADSIRNQPEQRRALIARNLVGQMMRGWTLVDAQLVDLDAHRPLTVRGKLRRRSALKPAGDAFLLPLPMAYSTFLRAWGGRGTRTLPFQLTSETAITWQITVDPGKAFEIREVPDAVVEKKMMMDFALRYVRKGAKVTITREFLQSPGRLSAKDFPSWRALLQRLDEAERANMKLVSRK